MADEQTNTPSAEPSPSADAEVSAQPSEQDSESTSESPTWWQRITRRQPQGNREEAGANQESGAGAEPGKVVLSQEELDRRVQAETDRRLAKRQQEAEVAAWKKLRDEDPWAYAEQERTAEQLQMSDEQVRRFTAAVGSEHDRVTLDPIFLALPQAEQDRILKIEGQGVGLAGRKLVVDESLKALEKHWKAEGAKDAEAKLRRNSAFRKQILSEMRGGTPEPELLPAGNMSEADKTISDLLRSRYNLG